ncbi:MAG: thiamine phosphate synthase [Alphaproteobacteria bacterium]|nr:thiamine phosphate synthase [Alphaproteobacteria bacterium]
MLREPHRDGADLRGLAETALGVGLRVWLHARHPDAHVLAADLRCGVHLPSHAHGTALPHGRSCHDGPALDRAFAEGAAYAFLSPVFPPTSKPDDRRPTLGVAGFLALAAGREVIALGGVDPDRAHALREAGAAGVAVLGGLFGSDPTALDAWRYVGPSMMNSSGS